MRLPQLCRHCYPTSWPCAASRATNSATNIPITFTATNNGPQTGLVWFENNDDFDDAPEGYGFEDPYVIYLEAFANPPGTPPTVGLTNLSNGQVLTTPPTLTIGATASATNPDSVTQVVCYATGPAGKSILGADSSGPPWTIQWSGGTGGAYALTALAIDSAGRAAFSAPTNIIVNNPPVAVDDAIEVTMNSTNDVNVLANDSDPNGHAIVITNIVSQGSKGTASIVDGVVYYVPNTDAFGRDSFKYGISDIYNVRATGTVSVLIRPSGQFYTINYTNSTQVAFPSNHVEIIGATNVIGTAHSDFLDYWKLEYRRRSTAPSVWALLATATTNVWNGLLGVFDPTSLPNGQYDLRVTLHDFFGSWQDSETTVIVTENNKIGHFTLGVTDLIGVIKFAGLGS
jgi:hypothetical protein